MTLTLHSSPTDLLPCKLVSHKVSYSWEEDSGLSSLSLQRHWHPDTWRESVKKSWSKTKSTGSTKGKALTNDIKQRNSDLTNGDSVWIRDQDHLGKIQKRTQHPPSFVIKTEKGTLWRNRSALVKAQLQSPSKVDSQATFTSTVSNHAVQDTEEMTGSSKLLCTTTEAPMQPVPSQIAPLQRCSRKMVKAPDRLDLQTNMSDSIRAV